jgi:hypothetical protein
MRVSGIDWFVLVSFFVLLFSEYMRVVCILLAGKGSVWYMLAGSCQIYLYSINPIALIRHCIILMKVSLHKKEVSLPRPDVLGHRLPSALQIWLIVK